MAPSSIFSREHSNVRSLVLASAATALALFIFIRSTRQDGRSASGAHEKGLHRSNAVRRSHRPLQRSEIGATSPSQIEQAVSNLFRRNEEGQNGYGTYTPPVHLQTAASPVWDLHPFLPRNLKPIYDLLLTAQPLNPREQNELDLNLHNSFVDAFLREEFRDGLIIRRDRDAILIFDALRRCGIRDDVIQETALRLPGFGTTASRSLSHQISEGLLRTSNPRNIQPQTDGTLEVVEPPPEGVEIPATVVGDELARPTNNDKEESSGSYDMYSLLFEIAADSARKRGYIHRGIECNSCGTCPIQGIRYHCSNCWDYDLCETCEAEQVHIRSHVFYKVRVPAPSRGHIKEVAPVWYPGKPNSLPNTLPKEAVKYCMEESGLEKDDIDALYDQFRCLAGSTFSADPIKLGMAIDRRGFDKFFSSSAKSPPNLIYDRIFAFYDTNNDELIGFHEFLIGLANLQDKTRHARLLRIFKGYDIDDDGYVDRKDFLRMFRAYYALTKEFTREIMRNNEEDEPEYGLQDEETIRTIVEGSAPISTAFKPESLHIHTSRAGVDKRLDVHGDFVINNGDGALQEDLPPYGEHAEAIGNAALGDRPRQQPFRSFREPLPSDEPLIPTIGPGPATHEINGASDDQLRSDQFPNQIYGWPPIIEIRPDDIRNGIGADVPVEEIMDPVDRSRVIFAQSERLDSEHDHHLNNVRSQAVEERFRRRDFYTDLEEGMLAPPGYTENDSSDEDESPLNTKISLSPALSSSRRTSMRSRSSSKVRFEDDVIEANQDQDQDTDYETRSNASSRSSRVPINERWGGYEITEVEKDIGKEMLYQAVEAGFNELLDPLFKAKEDLAMQAKATKRQRVEHADGLNGYEIHVGQIKGEKDEALRRADMLRTEELFANAEANSDTAEPDEHAITSAEQRISDKEEVDGHGIDWKSDPPRSPQVRKTSFEPRKDDIQKTVVKGKERNQQFDVWLKHKAIDAEAETRGGYGKLDFEEFEKIMVEDEDEDEVKASGKPGEEDEGDAENGIAWPKSAGLGRLGFVGSWLEMGSF